MLLVAFGVLVGVAGTPAYGYDQHQLIYDELHNSAQTHIASPIDMETLTALGLVSDTGYAYDPSGYLVATNTARGGDSLVLVKYPDYTRLADELGARRFSIPDAVWDAMGPTERWAANQAVLDQAIADRIPIVLSNPATPEFLTGTFGDEIAYLIKQGYEIGPDALSMVPGGS